MIVYAPLGVCKNEAVQHEEVPSTVIGLVLDVLLMIATAQCWVLETRKKDQPRTLLQTQPSDLNREDMHTRKYKLQSRMRKPCVAAQMKL